MYHMKVQREAQTSGRISRAFYIIRVHVISNDNAANATTKEKGKKKNKEREREREREGERS